MIFAKKSLLVYDIAKNTKILTDLFFVVGRTQLFDENDIENVRKLQDSYELIGLSDYLQKETPGTAALKSYPSWNEGDQFTPDAFKYIDFMLNLTNPVESELALRKKGTTANFVGKMNTEQYMTLNIRCLRRK